MENHKLILPEHLNQYGYLFGGNLLKWVDEIAWIAASLDYEGCHFVTVGLDQVEFRKSVREGTILRFQTVRTKVGTTSVQYQVEVSRARVGKSSNDPIFSTTVTLVRVDDDGAKIPLPGNGH